MKLFLRKSNKIYIHIYNKLNTYCQCSSENTDSNTVIYSKHTKAHKNKGTVCTTCMKHLIEYQIFTHYELYHMRSNRHETYQIIRA